MKARLSFSYDPLKDILTVEGTKYSGGFFRGIRFGELNRPYRIVRREDGAITIEYTE